MIDVFAMPQSGTGVSVEAVDPVFQARMLDMLRQTGRPEMVVGWYHSHPGFGKSSFMKLTGIREKLPIKLTKRCTVNRIFINFINRLLVVWC